MEKLSDLAKQLLWEMTPQHNKHGSNKSFKAFNDKYIGSGYGMAVHGRGHYTTPEKWYAKGFGNKIYNVDIPNKNFLFRGYNAFRGFDVGPAQNIKQSEWVLNELKNTNRAIDYFKLMPMDDEMWFNAMEYVPRQYQALDRVQKHIHKDLMNNKPIRQWQKDLFNRVANNAGLDAKAVILQNTNNNHLLKEVAGNIKGISTFDEFSTPVNLIFSDKDVRMSNNPIQYIKNRIPIQTMGMIGKKIMATPGVKPTLNFLGRASIPLAIYEGLNSPLSDEQEVMNNYNAVRGLPLQGGIKYYGK